MQERPEIDADFFRLAARKVRHEISRLDSRERPPKTLLERRFERAALAAALEQRIPAGVDHDVIRVVGPGRREEDEIARAELGAANLGGLAELVPSVAGQLDALDAVAQERESRAVHSGGR